MDLGLQVKEVATQLGADEQSVSGWELGHRQPSLVHLPAVIHWLGYDPRPLTESLGIRIRRWREARGLSQEHLARSLQVDPSTLANLLSVVVAPAPSPPMNSCSYRGEIVWNQTRKRDRWGQHK
jgi:transcriptional regulator with XRE-family HTH domain